MVGIEDLLKIVHEKNASDLHITVGLPPMLRINGDLAPTDNDVIKPEDAKAIIEGMLDDEARKRFEGCFEVDFSYTSHLHGRFRVNVYKQKNNLAAALRKISTDILSVEELGLPYGVYDLARKPGGLILVTGPTGSGKTTTLATMIDLINNERPAHIITIEDPIEYIHKHKRSMVNQREIHADTASFSEALKFALREDPDVILVGEMRDLETISSVITAGEAGDLVFATLHTNDAVQTIDRLIDIFPHEQQEQVRMQLSMCLQGVVSQRLLLRKDGKGRVAVVELMMVTPAISNLIREGRTPQIYSAIETGQRIGMQSMNQALIQLCRDEVINVADALGVSKTPEVLKKMLLSERQQ